jgi:hypothetical protein
MEEQKDLEQFKTQYIRCKGRQAKVRNSWGVRQAREFCRKNGWYDIGHPVSEHDFYAIVRGVNKLLAENIANGETVFFPEQMGSLELMKYQRGVKLVDGKLKNTYPIDWHNTLLLWEQDEEAKKKRIRLRHENEWVYHVKYDSWMAMYENKKLYRFALNTFIKWELSKNIKQGKVDTLW